mgnify:CR=1 FL=1
MKKLILLNLIALFIFNCKSDSKVKNDGNNLSLISKTDSLNYWYKPRFKDTDSLIFQVKNKRNMSIYVF